MDLLLSVKDAALVLYHHANCKYILVEILTETDTCDTIPVA